MKNIIIISFFLLVGLSGFGQSKDTTQWSYYRGKIKDISIFIKLSPNDEEKLFTRATYKAEIEDYSGVIEDINSCISLSPKNADYYYYRGYYKDLLFNEELSKSDEVIIDYSLALDIDSNHSKSLNNRANIYQKLEKFDLARKDMKKLISLNPDDPTSICNMARLYSAEGKKHEAITWYNNAIDTKSNFPVPYNNLGKIYTELKKYELAMDNYNKAIELDNNYTGALRNRADLKVLMKDQDGACQDLLIAARLGDKKAKLYYEGDCGKYPESQPTKKESEKNNIISTTTTTLPVGTYHFVTVDKEPMLNGTKEGFYKYLGENIKVPEVIKKSNEVHMVYVQFHISKKGKIYDVSIVKGAGEEIDKEILRVFNSMPNWSAGEMNGKKVNVQHLIPLRITP